MCVRLYTFSNDGGNLARPVPEEVPGSRSPDSRLGGHHCSGICSRILREVSVMSAEDT